MNCPKCQAPEVIVEASPDGKTQHLQCQKCGLNETRDAQGRKLLTEIPIPVMTGGQKILLEG